jgi:hypothetical protein
VVTYTGNGVAGREIAHGLDATVGTLIIRRTDSSQNWFVWHRAYANNQWLVLNETYDLATTGTTSELNNTTPTNFVFTVGSGAISNDSGGTYVAYLFAHDAGGFGDDGEQNVISCGSYVGNSSTTGVLQNLGWEPQWVLIKSSTDGSQDWTIFDNMRGVTTGVGAVDARLHPNKSDAENNSFDYVQFDATGFTPMRSQTLTNSSSNTYIYIAIRRGPMKTPEAGTEVFSPNTYTGNVTRTQKTSGFPVDFLISPRIGPTGNFRWAWNRLTGDSVNLRMNDVDPESTGTDYFDWDTNDGIFLTTNVNLNNTSNQYVLEMFQRAPGFMDVVCYTGTGSAKTEAHNLGVVPELMFVKNRSDATGGGRAWAVYAGDNTDYLVLNTTAATADDNTYWNDTSPTASVFTVGTNNSTNESGDTFVAYLFASLAGVSKIGTYTGNGTSVSVTTGFQPRFILVKRTDSTGNWLLGDSARGLVAGDDPFLVVNTTDAEVTNEDWVDVSATGFTINETAANANVSTATYLYLAIS